MSRVGFRSKWAQLSLEPSQAKPNAESRAPKQSSSWAWAEPSRASSWFPSPGPEPQGVCQDPKWTEQAEPSRAEPSGAEPNRVKVTRSLSWWSESPAEPDLEQSRVGSRTQPSRTSPCRTSNQAKLEAWPRAKSAESSSLESRDELWAESNWAELWPNLDEENWLSLASQTKRFKAAFGL